MNKVFTSIRTPEVRVNTKVPNVVAETLQKGRDGISIKDAYINEDNRLVIKLTDNTEYELGVVVGKDGYTPQKGIDYFDGEKGEPGYTPQKGIDYFDGEKGDPGRDGLNVVAVNITDSGELVVTLENGVTMNLGVVVGKDGYTPQKGIDYFDGEKGEPGYTPQKGIDYFDGEKGEPGYTPQKGIDYFDGEKGEPGYTPQKGIDYFDGEKGDPGRDGLNVVAVNITDSGELVVTLENGVTMNLGVVTGKDGYTPQKGIDYFDGEKGDPGYTPQKGIDYFDGEKGDPGYTPQKGIDYFDGEKGEPGYTPQKGIDYFDGEKGEPGRDGLNVTGFQINENGELIVTLEDGSKINLGVIVGKDGEPGENGKTPVAGVDYFTEAEKAEMINAVLAALPVAEGVRF